VKICHNNAKCHVSKTMKNKEKGRRKMNQKSQLMANTVKRSQIEKLAIEGL